MRLYFALPQVSTGIQWKARIPLDFHSISSLHPKVPLDSTELQSTGVIVQYMPSGFPVEPVDFQSHFYKSVEFT